ncbi:hypothetical protein AVEN_187978-1 [Araneus ventricosus]|uniref:Uncharacterized protein n=1 Tax=Araneus ventricosus TaxID=182803 RepID=A0A4Y2THV9_ARAVE|nr:hypothetical protein AVEN_187978-1 [Araneus ventricosus]
MSRRRRVVSSTKLVLIPEMSREQVSIERFSQNWCRWKCLRGVEHQFSSKTGGDVQMSRELAKISVVSFPQRNCRWKCLRRGPDQIFIKMVFDEMSREHD